MSQAGFNRITPVSTPSKDYPMQTCCKKVQADPIDVCPKIETAEVVTPDLCCKKKKVISCWSWLGALILWFIIFTVLFWLIYFSLKPSFVLQQDSNQVDTAKVLLYAVISAIILVLIIWLIKAVIVRNQ